MTVLAALIDTGELISSVVAALVSAILFTFTVSVSIRGAARWVDLGNEGRTIAATFSLLVSLLAGAASVALVAVGLFLLVST